MQRGINRKLRTRLREQRETRHFVCINRYISNCPIQQMPTRGGCVPNVTRRNLFQERVQASRMARRSNQNSIPSSPSNPSSRSKSDGAGPGVRSTVMYGKQISCALAGLVPGQTRQLYRLLFLHVRMGDLEFLCSSFFFVGLVVRVALFELCCLSCFVSR